MSDFTSDVLVMVCLLAEGKREKVCVFETNGMGIICFQALLVKRLALMKTTETSVHSVYLQTRSTVNYQRHVFSVFIVDFKYWLAISLGIFRHVKLG